MINVFIVDDHRMVIEGLCLLLQDVPNLRIAGTALSGEEAIVQIPTTEVDVVLLDINMPGINGIDTCKKLLKSNPELKIVAISMHKESSLIKLMLSNGAKGYVLKNAGRDEVITAITEVYNGKNYLDHDVSEIVLNSVMNQTGKKAATNFLLFRPEKKMSCIAYWMN